ncbi:oligosaccharide flippase family protein [Ectobacillus antri]|uniref:Oligosaccharide flippase family protein n=1 Tax=Ectobacillus antri TaxID=2486280 RepID=A0ABT6H8A0_9BACI|nr:oligosaccharide flippase family protein [Ectobacillus antri]MDG4658486.1 oligosaccharide flippase family protein [Ectobacillus antri]MDG5755488.1 oligosaccharide flippase family protein [Ectobacillus antri]
MIKPRLMELSNKRLFKNLSIVFSESVITKALNFISILILSRVLGPEDYGKYSFIFVTVAFCSAFFDFGMENTAVRFSARDKGITESIFGLYFFVKMVIVTLVVIVLVFWGDKIFVIQNKGDIVKYIPYLIIGYLGESLLFVNDTYLQAVKKFKLRATINIFRYLVFVLLIITLLSNRMLLLKYVFMLYILPIIISFPFLFKYVKFVKTYFSIGLPKGLLKEVIDYEKWMLMISIPNNTLGRIDFFMISLWVSYDQIGIYNAAFQMSAIVSFIPFAFGKVMLPTMAELDAQEVIKKTRKIMKPTLIISVVMLITVPLIGLIVPLILGKEYLQSVNILQVMLISAIFSFAIVPIEQAIYSLGKPIFITIGKYLQILIIILLIFVTVPSFGVVWAAISVALARLAYAIILIKLYTKNYKNSNYSAC